MAQLFDGSEDELKFYNIGAKLVEGMNADINDWFSNAYHSVDLGRILFDNNLFENQELLNRNLFLASYGFIEEYLEEWGVDGILNLVAMLYALPVRIIYTGVCAVNVQIIVGEGNTQEAYWRAQPDYEEARQMHGKIGLRSRKILFRRFIEDLLSINGLLKLLRKTTYHGCYIFSTYVSE